ncbi:redox-sensitive transcriptional activator SoxR [Blastococcus sp. TF02-09]|uniref:redox-sensitive transcriptional activator SoxR n=1 Tax=Blastococcus sp. TF02-09 TaxID=2250576 RepID=UPI000DE97E3C|nr:redox-sensitive transcriptional activator SoxR [Blastococcus sp. TF02-9]RBY79353.1 redox-sensitive transcriptional activator SoxR [Blastococcus sp. TF02-9]
MDPTQEADGSPPGGRDRRPIARELTVGQLAARGGVTVSALHFFERVGLLTSTRTAGNQRRYRRDTLRRIALIRVAQRTGIPLKEVAEVLAVLPQQRTPTREDWAQLSQSWQARLDQRIRRLQQLRNEFTDCIGCGCLSIDRCLLVNPDDQLGANGPGPRVLDLEPAEPPRDQLP